MISKRKRPIEYNISVMIDTAGSIMPGTRLSLMQKEHDMNVMTLLLSVDTERQQFEFVPLLYCAYILLLHNNHLSPSEWTS
jgi:ethanolamine utilization protein EutP (predicted NTPase)